MRLVFILSASAALLACTGALGTAEGGNPGECADDADNDGDGDFDCDDPDCAGAASCVEEEADTDTDSDSDSDSDTDADPQPSASWSGDGLQLDIDGGRGTYLLGLAETGAVEGWYGEDGVGGMGGFDIRHDGVSANGISLESVSRLEDVEANVSTLFSASTQASLTYLLYANDDSGCWVWGDDTAYYADLDCTDVSE